MTILAAPRGILTHLAAWAPVLILLAFPSFTSANNIAVSNVRLTDQDTGSDVILVEFDISWENSWRVSSSPSNWDAAWVFVKYRVAGGNWAHATLSTSGHTAPAGSTIDTASDGTGVFLYRSADGGGTFSLTDVKLRWNYGANSVSALADQVEVRVLAIEMVYVPEAGFAAGDGGASPGRFTLTTINTASATTAPAGTGSLGGKAGGYPEGQTAPDAATWPNGYSAFYIQKYEITQGQYADFLNLLTSTQAGARAESPLPVAYRYTITESSGVYTASVPDRANNYLSWDDGVAYADWAGLRPMTELEFEKAARGTATPVAYEYAWGSTSIGTDFVLTNDGTANSTAMSQDGGDGNARYSDNSFVYSGPFRVGIFAASSATPTRAQAGASFYGVMELSGNVNEQAVSLHIAGGRSFDGGHGDGSLTSAGGGDASTWPGGAAIFMRRGGCHVSDRGSLEVSHRNTISPGPDYRDLQTGGFRAVRSAP